MQEFARVLGEVVKRARKELDLTQFQVAEKIDADPRTILNIENFKGNPKMEVLFPLIRALKIDAREIFNPEMKRESPAIRQLRFLIEDCSEQEAAALVSIISSVLAVLRAREPLGLGSLHNKRACPCLSGSRLCALSVRLIA